MYIYIYIYIYIVTDTHLEHHLENAFIFYAETYVVEHPETLTLRTSQYIKTYLILHVIIMIY